MSNDGFNEQQQRVPKGCRVLYTEEQLAAQKDLSFNDGYKVGFDFSELKNKEKLEGLNGLLGSYRRAVTDMLSIMEYMGNEALFDELRDNILKNEAIEDEVKLMEITLEVKSYLQALSSFKKNNEFNLKILNSNKDRLTRDKDRLIKEVSNLKLKIDEYENVIAKHKEESEIAKHKEEKVRVKTKLWNKLFKSRG